MIDKGWLSLLPPIVALLLALVTRSALLSLGVGAVVGATILAQGDPLRGVVDAVENGVFAQITATSHVQVLVVILLIGGFARLLSNSARPSSAKLYSRSGGARLAQLTTWFTGVGIFFTDSGSPLLLGPLFRPLFDRTQTCREKLAYILDTTAFPVAILVPFATWGVYTISLVEQSHALINSKVDGFSLLMEALYYQFYPLLALFTALVIAITGRDFGPMRRAQQASREDKNNGKKPSKKSGKAPASVVKISVAMLLLTIVVLFSYHYYTLKRLPQIKIFSSLVIAYALACIVCTLLLRRHKITSFTEAYADFIQGVAKTLGFALVLIFAWVFSDICKSLGTGNYIANQLQDYAIAEILPAGCFVVAAVISFATGSLQATLALLMPMAVAAASGMAVPMPLTIAAVLSGGAFGEHTSPIAETTVLSSMGADCRHLSHVYTQLPYAGIAGLIALLAFIVAGVGAVDKIAMLVGAGVLATIALSVPLYWKKRDKNE